MLGPILITVTLYIYFHQKIESVQRKVYLAITGAIIDTSKEKLYDELVLELLQLPRWYRKLSYLYKLCKNESPQYLFKLASLRHSLYTTRYTENISFFKTKHNFLKKNFLPQQLSRRTVLPIKFEISKELIVDC